ncbi:MAG: hypothetical protein Q9159_002335 [Coniocarpon cinnabarinum]
MRCSYQTLALFGLAAVHAAPVAKPQSAQSTDYSSLWQSQLSSMASVQSAMGNANPTPVAPSGKQPYPTTVVTTQAVTTQAANPPSYQSTQPSLYSAPSVYSAPNSAPSAPATTISAALPPNSYLPSSPTTSSGPAEGSSSAAGSSTGGSGSGSGANPSGPAVTVQAAFASGAACHEPSATPPSQPPQDSYQCFGSNYPSQDTWATFEDLWTANSKLLSEACTNLGDGADNTADQTQAIRDGIMQVSGESFVDPRFIMAIMMQESHGCVNVGTTSNGVSNPGLMQSHNGVSFSASDPKGSITQMIRDGVQGTASGDGLVQILNAHGGDPWKASRVYNSGSIAPDGDLNNGNGATASYVMDVANRLKGWSLNPGIAPQC